MKLSSKTIIPVLLAGTVICGTALATDKYGPGPSWDGYKSVSSSMPISQSYNDIEANRTDTQSTEMTDNSKSAVDSFNRAAEFDLDSTADSYNDNSVTSSKTKTQIELDASRRMDDSYNTDNSKKAADSFNTDNSNHDSFNTTTQQRWQAVTDSMTANPIVTSTKDVSAGDVQGASNSGYMSGPNQAGFQGGLDIGGIGNDAPSSGGGWGSEYGYGGQDNRQSSNAQEIAVYGPNLGAVSNTSVSNMGRDLVFGPNRSVLGSDFGNKQIFSAGPQTQVQTNEQLKAGDTSANATDTITNSASKASKTRQ